MLGNAGLFQDELCGSTRLGLAVSLTVVKLREKGMVSVKEETVATERIIKCNGVNFKYNTHSRVCMLLFKSSPGRSPLLQILLI